MLILYIFIFIVHLCLICDCNENSIVMAMILRDEAVNINSNLHLWLSTINFFIFLVDTRTQDDTINAISSILGDKDYHILNYTFEGFGVARTLSLQYAWSFYPHATHVLIADPDWRPEVSTLNKNELDDTSIYRFLVYDRNGELSRHMDWLLLHRNNLKMKYNLHEVIDIPFHDSKLISWVIHEVELPGSWHTTAGHGHSMSAKRLSFDLQLLQKDLARYDHDRHTHKYLGLTFAGYAERLMVVNYAVSDDAATIQYSIEQAIHYLMLCSTSIYDEESLEDRWMCMYTLGILYLRLEMRIEAERWLKSCHDISPQQTECATALLNLYEETGSKEDVLDQLQIILRAKVQQRYLFNNYKHYPCDVATHAIRVLSMFAIHNDSFTRDDVRYCLHLATISNSYSCASMDRDISPHMKYDLKELQKRYEISDEETMQFCLEFSMQQYITTRSYRLHNCSHVTTYLDDEQFCASFHHTTPSTNEKYQIEEISEFVGGANIPDIVHHIYRGSTSKVFRGQDSNKFRILFAFYFHPKGLFNLLGYISRLPLSFQLSFEIVVAHLNANYLSFLRHNIQTCHPDMHILVHYSVIPSVEDIKIALQPPETVLLPFDYVEFNGAPSLDSAKASIMIANLKELIGDDGTIGITYFTTNKYTTAIQAMIRQINVTSHPPFSSNKREMVKRVLHSFGLNVYTSDSMLVASLASSDLTTYTKTGIEQHLASHELRVVAWIPSLWTSPYGTLGHFAVQQLKSFGVTENDFIENFISHFRVTVYVTNTESKAYISKPFVHRIDDTVVNNMTRFLVRTKRIEDIFMNVHELTSQTKSFQLKLALPCTDNGIILRYNILHHSLAAFSILKDNPTYGQLLNINYRTAPYPYDTLQKTLMRNDLNYHLDVLVSFDLVTFWSPPLFGSNSLHYSEILLQQDEL